jgi:hypothetical protein
VVGVVRLDGAEVVVTVVVTTEGGRTEVTGRRTWVRVVVACGEIVTGVLLSVGVVLSAGVVVTSSGTATRTTLATAGRAGSGRAVRIGSQVRLVTAATTEHAQAAITAVRRVRRRCPLALPLRVIQWIPSERAVCRCKGETGRNGRGGGSVRPVSGSLGHRFAGELGAAIREHDRRY